MFKRKRIVYSKNMMPGELVKIFTSNGKRYVRIAFTNRVKYAGTKPVTDILFSDVTGIRKMPFAFIVKLCREFDIKVKGTFYKIG